jgi:hypothetical protein
MEITPHSENLGSREGLTNKDPVYLINCLLINCLLGSFLPLLLIFILPF